MATGIREFLNSKFGYGLTIIMIVMAVVWLFISLKSNLGQAEGISLSTRRVFVCSETRKSFEVEIEPGMKIPVRSPYSGRDTGYEFNEVCNWTADGKVDSKSTYVLMNKTIGNSGPTFCPTCGRQVVTNNPEANPNHKPPPTETEYRTRQSNKK